jgi:hypothetical protein
MHSSGRGLNPATGLEPTEGVGCRDAQLEHPHMQGRRKNGCNMKEHCIISGCEGEERVDACQAGEDRSRGCRAVVAPDKVPSSEGPLPPSLLTQRPPW